MNATVVQRNGHLSDFASPPSLRHALPSGLSCPADFGENACVSVRFLLSRIVRLLWSHCEGNRCHSGCSFSEPCTANMNTVFMAKSHGVEGVG